MNIFLIDFKFKALLSQLPS